jgi:site-specific DNA-methyltransferase (adenine-specific)
MSEARVVCGDCLAEMLELPEAGFDAVVTDPPYGVPGTTIHNFQDRPNARRGRRLTSEFGSWNVWDTAWVSLAAHLLRPGGALVSFCPDRRISSLADDCERAGLTFRQSWYWHKLDPPMTFRGVLQFAVEPMIYAVKGKGARLRVANAGRAHNVFEFPTAKRRRHPNEKPVELLTAILSRACREGGRVLDPFCGSGTTLVAAVRLGMSAVGIELNPRYAAAAARRVEAEQRQLRLPMAAATHRGRGVT